ncbi:winged helix-turn-helix domain-containing protein [Natronoarchaeum sp. GCM10025703]|uniref:Winged helix-turn-helix domain-containing protein n=1 Tax=Halospeciosus flavus TaxID=3032283 RepID=A0ABD5YZ02_9EURY
MSTCDTEGVSDLAPSAKLVYKVLEYNGELTQKQIAEKSLLSPRTVRYALNELESAGVVEDDIYFADARQRLYRLTESDTTGAE